MENYQFHFQSVVVIYLQETHDSYLKFVRRLSLGFVLIYLKHVNSLGPKCLHKTEITYFFIRFI